MSPPWKPILGMELEWHILAYRGKEQDSAFFKCGSDEGDQGVERRNMFLRALRGYPCHFYPEFNQKSGAFLLNGARAYFDVPEDSYFEWATPEASSAESLVAYAKAAEENIREAIGLVNRNLEKEGIVLKSFKSNLDSHGNTRGTHENYLLPPDRPSFAELLEKLGPHLVSRIICSGNGHLGIDGTRFHYHLSQRAGFMKEDVGGATTSSRAILNTKGEPHAGNGYRRLHLILGDALMFEPAIFLQVGTTYIVLAMLIKDYLRDFPFLLDRKDETKRNPLVEIFRVFNQDDTLQAKGKFLSGEYSALEVQRYYYERACQFYTDEEEPTKDVRKILALWKTALDAAAGQDPHEHLSSLTDWAAKKVLLAGGLMRRGFDWHTNPATLLARAGKEKHPELFFVLKALELAFHENDPRGHAHQLIAMGNIERVTTRRKIQYARVRPFRENRAYARALQLRTLDDEAKNGRRPFKSFSVDWEYIQLHRESDGDLVWEAPDPRDFKNRSWVK